MWGDDTGVWDPDPDVDAEGNPVRKMTAGGFELSRLEQLYNCMDAVIADGGELMQIYIDGCRRHGIAAIASMRMNDAHTSDEAREWQVRSRHKKSRPDLLIGSPTPTRAGGADRWNFCWQWDYEQEEVRGRFLGLVDETLERYDFDGVELDWMRGPPYFRPGRLLDNLDTLTGFMREAHSIVRGHGESKGKPISLLARVPPCLAEARAIGIDAPAWIREPVADLFVLSSSSYCPARFDIAEAVACAGESGVPVYVGFDGATHLTSPHEGYDRGVPAVLRGAALNGYEQGASGVYIFNYDYRHHRAAPFEEGGVQRRPPRPADRPGRSAAAGEARPQLFRVGFSPGWGGPLLPRRPLPAGPPRPEHAGPRHRRSRVRDEPRHRGRHRGRPRRRPPTRHRAAPAPGPIAKPAWSGSSAKSTAATSSSPGRASWRISTVPGWSWRTLRSAGGRTWSWSGSRACRPPTRGRPCTSAR